MYSYNFEYSSIFSRNYLAAKNTKSRPRINLTNNTKKVTKKLLSLDLNPKSPSP